MLKKQIMSNTDQEDNPESEVACPSGGFMKNLTSP
jgi:hypothetical protein